MPNYQLGKIYKIVNLVTDDVYVGSTSKKYLSSRFGCHIQDAKDETRHSKLNLAIRQYGRAQFQISLLENFPCNSDVELQAREQYYIEELNPEYNQNAAHLTYEEMRKKKNEYEKQYRLKNPDIIKRIAKGTREKNKEKYKLQRKVDEYCNICKCDVRKDGMKKHEVTTKHLDMAKGIVKLSEDETRKIDIHCDLCNTDIRTYELPRHKKSKKHLKNELKRNVDENNI